MHEATDEQTGEHNHDTFIVRDDHSAASRGEVNVINSRHWVFMPVCCPDGERDKGRHL